MPPHPDAELSGYRHITTHYDGHGLNERIALTADPIDGSGASHDYMAAIAGRVRARVQFQKGPRNAVNSTPGVTTAALLAILIDHIEGFQLGPFACAENDVALDHLQQALMAVRRRADDRADRGVLGTEAQ